MPTRRATLAPGNGTILPPNSLGYLSPSLVGIRNSTLTLSQTTEKSPNLDVLKEMEISSGPHSITFTEFNDSNSNNQETPNSESPDDRTAEAFRTKVSQTPRPGEHRKYSATPFSEALMRSHSRDRRNASFPY